MARNRGHRDDEGAHPRRRKRARRKSSGGMFWVLGGLGFVLVVVVGAAIALKAGRKRDGSEPNLSEVVPGANDGGTGPPVDPPGAEYPYGHWAKPTDSLLAPAGPPEAGLVGEWRLRFKGGKVGQNWVVQCRRVGTWEVSGVVDDGENLASEFVGTDVKVSGRTLSFTQHFEKAPPPPPWVGEATVTAQLVDLKMTLEDEENPPFKGNKVTVLIGGKSYRIESRKLEFTWRAGADRGTGTMELVGRQTPLVPEYVPGPRK